MDKINQFIAKFPQYPAVLVNYTSPDYPGIAYKLYFTSALNLIVNPDNGIPAALNEVYGGIAPFIIHCMIESKESLLESGLTEEQKSNIVELL